MGYNAIEIDGEVKLDLSEDTVTEDTLPEGVTAHDANGEPIQGKMKFVKSINGKTGDVTLNASDVGADEAGTVSTHNTNTDAHNDIRLELTRLSGIINDVLDSDDINLDELHEIVAYIKSNSALITAITVSKVNVADIINNLTTNVTDKPLSAAQGVAIKGLIDNIDKTSIGLPNVENIKQYSENNEPPYPVTKVNQKKGEVILTAKDVGARPDSWMPTASDVGARPESWMPTASDVGARPDSWMPTALEVGARPDSWMPTALEVGARPSDWTPSYSDVGADKEGTATTAVSNHNVATDAHNDIRLELKRLSGIINDVLDSEDTDLNELHEIVAYIKSNSALIAAITVSKVNVADIINNLTTNVTAKPLSAAQGVAIKGLIDDLASGKLDASKLTEAINTALAEAKASGKFDGESGIGIDEVTINDDGELEITYTDGNSTNVGKVKGEDGKDGVLTTEQEALLAVIPDLKAWYDESHYVKMTGTLSMSPSTTTYEVNDSKSVTFSWSFSKTPIEVIFNGQTQANATSGSKTLTVTSSTPATKTYSLYGKYKEGETVTRELTINFRNYRYWGMAEYTDTIDSVLLAKLNKEFATSRTKNFNLGDSSSDKHIWYIFPTRFGTAFFTANGLKGGFEYLGEKELSNSKGFKEYFHVYCSTEAGVGTADIVVS